MEKDTRSRKWQITINNPAGKGYTHEAIKAILHGLKGLTYWCMADEVGENGTYHTHIYICSNGAVRFSTLQNRFNGAHMEMAKGTSSQNRDYVFKEGKWEGDKKKETNLSETQEEHGECPVERQGCRNDIHDLYAMVKEGLTDYQILEQNPEYMLSLDKVERTRQVIKEESYKNEFRELEVTYIYGATGTGKTRGVMEKYGYASVYRVVDYEHPFDGYRGQDVVLFEEFASSLKIHNMLLYLDGYPLELPCRYANKVACYTKVYFTTNVGLLEQYASIQRESPAVWEAFLRRIHKVVEYASEDIKEYPAKQYLRDVAGWHPVDKNFWERL